MRKLNKNFHSFQIQKRIVVAETICGNTVVSSLDEENIQGEKNIQGRKLYEEILYSRPVKKTSTFFLITWQAARECNATVNEK